MTTRSAGRHLVVLLLSGSPLVGCTAPPVHADGVPAREPAGVPPGGPCRCRATVGPDEDADECDCPHCANERLGFEPQPCRCGHGR